jgi:hypothetical protein
MKGHKKSCTGRGSLLGLVIVGVGLLSLTCQTNAQIFTLVDNNSVAQVSPNSQAGMFHWDVQGQNQLQQQWFWYGVGAGPVHSIETISPANVVTPSARELTTTYVNPGNYSVSIDYLLTGGSTVAAGGHANADIGETIKIVNLSGATLAYHFYQYSYFNLAGASSDIVQLGTNPRGLYNDALQQDDSVALSETVTTPGANHGEVAFYNNGVGDTKGKLNSGGPVLLNNNSGPVGPGAVTWALEWDLNIAAGGSAIISKDKYLDVVVVPEPSTLALIGLGGIALSFWRRQRAA